MSSKLLQSKKRRVYIQPQSAPQKNKLPKIYWVLLGNRLLFSLKKKKMKCLVASNIFSIRTKNLPQSGLVSMELQLKTDGFQETREESHIWNLEE